jgi:hypothetical protein
MRLCFCFVFIYQFFLTLPIFAQPKDTAGIRYDSARALVQKTVQQWKDSVERERLLQNMQKNGKSLDAFLAEMKENEEKVKRRNRIRFGAGAILLFMLFFTIARRYRQRKRA